MLDGATQITKRDEFIYQEMMSHVPLFAPRQRARGADRRRRRLRHRRGGAQAQNRQAPHPGRDRRDGGRIRQRAFSGIHQAGVRRQTLRERDRRRHEICRQNRTRRFDVIIVDSTDPQGPGKVLFSQKFYRACKRCLNKGGVLVTQNGVPIFQPRELDIQRRQIPSAVCGRQLLHRRHSRPMSAATWRWAGRPTTRGYRRTPVKTIAARYRKAGGFATKYWTPEVHMRRFRAAALHRRHGGASRARCGVR